MAEPPADDSSRRTSSAFDEPSSRRKSSVARLAPEQQTQGATSLKANGKGRACEVPGVAELQAQFTEMRADSKEMSSAIRPELRFSHLGDARPIHGLLDWIDLADWAEERRVHSLGGTKRDEDNGIPRARHSKGQRNPQSNSV